MASTRIVLEPQIVHQPVYQIVHQIKKAATTFRHNCLIFSVYIREPCNTENDTR